MARADQRKFHYIYKITRTDGSGKYYIGMHSTDDLEDGYFGSGQLLWKSIDKHGKEKHAKEILEFLPSRKELKERERQLVNEEILDDPLCMNLKLGGEGGWDHLANDPLFPEKRNAALERGRRTQWSDPVFIEKMRIAAKHNLILAHKNGLVPHDGFKNKHHSTQAKLAMGCKTRLNKLVLGIRNTEHAGFLMQQKR